MVFGELDPLVGLHTRGAQVLDTFHAEPGGFSVVVAGHTELRYGQMRHASQTVDRRLTNVYLLSDRANDIRTYPHERQHIGKI